MAEYQEKLSIWRDEPAHNIVRSATEDERLWRRCVRAEPRLQRLADCCYSAGRPSDGWEWCIDTVWGEVKADLRTLVGIDRQRSAGERRGDVVGIVDAMDGALVALEQIYDEPLRTGDPILFQAWAYWLCLDYLSAQLPRECQCEAHVGRHAAELDPDWHEAEDC